MRMDITGRVNEMEGLAGAREAKLIIMRYGRQRDVALGVCLPGSGPYNDGIRPIRLEWYRPEGHDDDPLSSCGVYLRHRYGRAIASYECDAVDDGLYRALRQAGIDPEDA